MVKLLKHGSVRSEVPDDWTYVTTEDGLLVATPKRRSDYPQLAVVLGEGGAATQSWADFVGTTLAPLGDTDLLGVENNGDTCRFGFVYRLESELFFSETRAGRSHDQIWYANGTCELGTLPLHVDEFDSVMTSTRFEEV